MCHLSQRRAITVLFGKDGRVYVTAAHVISLPINAALMMACASSGLIDDRCNRTPLPARVQHNIAALVALAGVAHADDLTFDDIQCSVVFHGGRPR